MLTNGGNASGRVDEGLGEQLVGPGRRCAPVVQVRPSSAIRAGADRRPDVEHVALLADRLGADGSRSARRVEQDRPACPSGPAAARSVCPTGPLPTTTHGQSCRSSGRSMAVIPGAASQTSRSRSAVQITRPLDAGQLVPEPGDVERQAVLEDRPAPVLLVQGGVGGLERVLQRAAALLHGADLGAASRRGSGGSARWRRRPPSRPREHGAAPADQRLGAERARRASRVAVDQSRWNASPV